ncbi:MAG: DUF1345 domain-containing protein [Herpetosiphonaceae bacterium]|nr:DUF1345 domain-containing protein [Herpetosiphonaceae bacterium]
MNNQARRRSKPSRFSLKNDSAAVARWPAALAFLSIGGIYLLISGRHLSVPSWLILAAVLVLLVPINIARLNGLDHIVKILARGLTMLVTVIIASSAALLLIRLQGGGTKAGVLLRDAALIWIANILCFALWYWEIDGGGPNVRRLDHHASSDFLFPQMTMDPALVQGWAPDFLDYLFLAFNTSTAFSPTDTMVLSRRAKGLMMIQSLISLLVIAVLAARAINTLS